MTQPAVYALVDHLMQPGDSPDLDDLVALLERPGWMADALCKEYPALSWFPGQGEPNAEQKAVCARCSVRDECLAYGLEHDAPGAPQGIWGGVAAIGRKRMRRSRAA